MQKTSTQRNWVFDCDGVLLNSNEAKYQAMFDATRPFGEKEAHALVTYHRARGGVGREVKFRHFFKTILGREDDFTQDYEQLLARYSQLVQESLKSCDVAPALDEVMSALKQLNVQSFVISGAEQTELRSLLRQKSIDQYFERVFGSPRSKTHWMKRISDQYGPVQVCIGDSQHDYDVALEWGAHFVFMSRWTEWQNGASFLKDHAAITVLDDTRALLNLLREMPETLDQIPDQGTL